MFHIFHNWSLLKIRPYGDMTREGFGRDGKPMCVTAKLAEVIYKCKFCKKIKILDEEFTNGLAKAKPKVDHENLKLIPHIGFNELKLTQLTEFCPEQFLARIGKKMIGFLHISEEGNFTVRYPDVWGKVVYENRIKGRGFLLQEEKGSELIKAKKALLAQINY